MSTAAMSPRPDLEHTALPYQPSKHMRISHNLHAALEYDERTRVTTERSSSPGPSTRSSSMKITTHELAPNVGGLRPPPRPKSRTSSVGSKKKTPPTSPTSPNACLQPPLPSSSNNSPNASASNTSIPTTPNPYVNPPPRIPHLMEESVGAASRAHARRPSLPGSPRSFESRSSDSPRSEKGSPVSASDSRAGFQRHLRYLSALPGVLRRQTMAVGKTNDEGESRPSTPSPGREQLHWQGRSGDGERSGRPRTGGTRPAQDADPAGLTRLPRRSLISHGRRGSAASTTASSESSHDPATPTDPRISISSTAYNDSLLSFRDDHHPDIPLTPPIMSDSDRESFIDLASPSPQLTEFASNAAHGSSAGQQSIYPSSSRNHHHHHHHKPKLPQISTKPPVPTSPKPDFRRSKSAQRHAHRDSSKSPVQEVTVPRAVPPTTNLLDPRERAERVRKTRKLAQVFGQTPAAVEAIAFSQLSFEANVPTGLLCAPTNLSGKRKHQRGAVSMSVAPPSPEPQGLWPPQTEAARYAALNSRRHSTPLTPDSHSFMEDMSPVDLRSTESANSRHSSAIIEISSQQGAPRSDWSSHAGHTGPTSPTSFIDLSEEEVLADGVSSIISLETPRGDRRPGLPHSASSIYSFTSDELAEEDRRRKREKLAKLHRFLGSRVPIDAILNQLSLDDSLDLPPVAPVSAVEHPMNNTHMDTDARKVWLRRRRSSSAAELSSKWSDEVDRLREELNDKEKAQNVKRALKMEKMFGVAPPQTLYHTRSAAPPTGSAGPSASSSPQTFAVPTSPVSPGSRNINQSAYARSKSKSKAHRPGTADSSAPLMGGSTYLDVQPGFSDIYEHYRHSLNSLNDIIDRDDRESLHHLHSLIHGDAEPSLQPFVRQEDSPPPSPPTPKAERRRSLPARASMTSLFSEYSFSTITSPAVEENSFQARRRRAAKLTQFFGVDYRDLMNEVFDSLEKGLEEESGRGTLRPDEVQELLNKLRKLKSKRNSLFD